MTERRTLRTAEERLLARFGAHLPDDVVLAAVADAYGELRAGATVTAYLEILAERLAHDRLVALEARGTRAAAHRPSDPNPQETTP